MIKLAKIFSILVITAFILTGCMSRGKVEFREEEKIIKSIDFTKYKEKGFLITPGDYGADFEAIGMFWFTIYPSCHRDEMIPADVPPTAGFSLTNSGKSSTWQQEKRNLHKVFDLIYQEALSRKADGIIRLKIREVEKNFMDGDYKEWIFGTEVSGLLIKRN